MAGPKGAKYYDIFLHYRVWLENRTSHGTLDDQLVLLLKAIRESGSLSSAADMMGISYRKAWGDIGKAEEFLGFKLVEKIRGGKDGGLSRLTLDGKELVDSFEELHSEFDQSIYRITRKFFHNLNK